uniref:Uncharacterized protein n=1 Tax=Lepeophtheirus salmonis TaxID=72036 RepID=A0A0K2TXG4_LEPSM
MDYDTFESLKGSHRGIQFMSKDPLNAAVIDV